MRVFCDLRELRLLRERAEDGHSDALFLRSAGSADAVDIILVLLRHVVVDHAVDIVDVDAARGNVGCNENRELSFFERAHGFFTLLLRNVAVDAVRLDAEAL